MDPSRNRLRDQKRKKLFEALCTGREALWGYNANHFLEELYNEGDPVTCIGKVDTSNAGLSTPESAMWPIYQFNSLILRQKGQNAGMYDSNIHHSEWKKIKKIWNFDQQLRRQHFKQWEDALVQESIEAFASAAREYSECQEGLMRAQNTSLSNILLNKRIVGCTTTAAAKYGDELPTFNSDVLLVEEAGEILESHVLTAIGLETSQMILIGDDEQLRPKVNHYLLKVEKGHGYDPNRSLFERLILKDYPHESLTQATSDASQEFFPDSQPDIPGAG